LTPAEKLRAFCLQEGIDIAVVPVAVHTAGPDGFLTRYVLDVRRVAGA
jgi:hypothetical protein